MMDILSQVDKLFQDVIRGFEIAFSKIVDNAMVWGKQLDLMFTHIYIALETYEWWMAPFLETLTLQQMAYIYKRIENKPTNVGKRYIDLLVVLLYGQNNYKMLDKIIGKWSNKNFEKRNKIFMDALWAHKKKRYTLSTLALIPQIEGIIREYTENTKRGSSWQQDFEKKYDYNGDLKTQYDKLLKPNMTMEEQIALSKNFRITLNIKRIIDLFASGDFENQQFVNGFKRHPMLHGLCIKYNEVNSLKSFLLLDLIHDFITDNVVV